MYLDSGRILQPTLYSCPSPNSSNLNQSQTPGGFPVCLDSEVSEHLYAIRMKNARFRVHASNLMGNFLLKIFWGKGLHLVAVLLGDSVLFSSDVC